MPIQKGPGIPVFKLWVNLIHILCHLEWSNHDFIFVLWGQSSHLVVFRSLTSVAYEIFAVEKPKLVQISEQAVALWARTLHQTQTVESYNKLRYHERCIVKVIACNLLRKNQFETTINLIGVPLVDNTPTTLLWNHIQCDSNSVI